MDALARQAQIVSGMQHDWGPALFHFALTVAGNEHQFFGGRVPVPGYDASGGRFDQH